MSKKNLKIAIIGAGASGMIAAIVASRNGASVTLFEKNDRVGKKILVTGNGKCNFTNRDLNLNCYRSGNLPLVNNILERFPTEKILGFFENEGMLYYEKNGYFYPLSGQASTVLDILRRGLKSCGVHVKTECEVVDISKENDSYLICYNENGRGCKSFADRVIVSAGSIAGIKMLKEYKNDSFPGSYQLLNKLNLPMVPLAQALVQIQCKGDFFKSVSGVRLNGKLDLHIDGKKICSEEGEVQLTNYGVSGIPTFQLSRFVSYALHEHKNVKLYIDCLPDFDEKELMEMFSSRPMNHDETVEEYFLGLLNKKIILAYLHMVCIKPTSLILDVPKKKVLEVFKLMKKLTLEVTNVNPFDQAQVCAGGLSMDAVNENLQVKQFPGLYVVGEMLDVDGRCGGYNLHWAFSTGICAANDACKRG